MKPGQELITDPPAPSQEEPGIFDWLFTAAPGRVFLPATGLWIVGLDWLLFSEEVASLGLSMPVTSVFGFLAGSMGAYRLQRRYAGDDRRRAIIKALLAGAAVGVPFPLAGTLVGAWILTNSGLPSLKGRPRQRQ